MMTLRDASPDERELSPAYEQALGHHVLQSRKKKYSPVYGVQSFLRSGEKDPPSRRLADDWTQLGGEVTGVAANDQSGTSVSLSGNGQRVAIGTLADYVRVYDWSGTEWLQLGGDISDGVTSRFGDSVSLSFDGMRLAIGTPYKVVGGVSDVGCASVYEWNSAVTQWTTLGQDMCGVNAGENAGFSVSISSDGTVVAVGAPNSQGTTRVYKYNQGTIQWEQLGGDIIGQVANEQSGQSVSLSKLGTTIAIGGPNFDNNAGITRVYDYVTLDWIMTPALPGQRPQGEYFGKSVSLSANGNIVAVGAPKHSTGAHYRGRVQVFQRNGGGWSQLGGDIIGDYLSEAGWSLSLSADGTRVAIGYYGQGTRVFSLVGAIWTQVAGAMSGNGVNSVSLSASGERVAAGVPGFNSNRGRTRVWMNEMPNQDVVSFEIALQGKECKVSDNGLSELTSTLDEIVCTYDITVDADTTFSAKLYEGGKCPTSHGDLDSAPYSEVTGTTKYEVTSDSDVFDADTDTTRTVTIDIKKDVIPVHSNGELVTNPPPIKLCLLAKVADINVEMESITLSFTMDNLVTVDFINDGNSQSGEVSMSQHHSVVVHQCTDSSCGAFVGSSGHPQSNYKIEMGNPVYLALEPKDDADIHIEDIKELVFTVRSSNPVIKDVIITNGVLVKVTDTDTVSGDKRIVKAYMSTTMFSSSDQFIDAAGTVAFNVDPTTRKLEEVSEFKTSFTAAGTVAAEKRSCTILNFWCIMSRMRALLSGLLS